MKFNPENFSYFLEDSTGLEVEITAEQLHVFRVGLQVLCEETGLIPVCWDGSLNIGFINGTYNGVIYNIETLKTL